MDISTPQCAFLNSGPSKVGAKANTRTQVEYLEDELREHSEGVNR